MHNPLPPRKDTPSFWREGHEGKAFLHLGENPFPPSTHVQNAIARAAAHVNRYPDTNCLALREKLAEYIGHGATAQNVICGNGSDDLIDLSVVALTRPGETVGFFPPSFFYYHFVPERQGRAVRRFARVDGFALPSRGDIEREPGAQDVALWFIANPNNPTGSLTPRAELLELTASLPGVVVVDECYFEFGGETVADWAMEREGRVVLRSLSKCFGLAGVRLGYAVAHPATIDVLERFALTFPVNALAQAAGLAALDEIDANRLRIEALIARRGRFAEKLAALGAEVIPSRTNFILSLWPEGCDAMQRLASAGILVSDQTAAVGAGRLALRIAIGTEEEMDRAAAALGYAG
ncbi:MAG: aminotransferase class I/II-fold pyridoxal phosphate-dependent enzyme [bacterium]|nr:aminotransferase class I/II-fold pyridoxal phosphate-dependent enzyme [bacterium]